jgi:hypothetical protein
MELKLKRFDPKSIPDDKTVLLVGRRGSGKSCAVRELMYHCRHIPYGIVFSPTEDANEAYGKHVPRLFIFKRYEENVVKKLLMRQKKACKAGNLSPAFLIMDDCLYEKGILGSDTIREILMNGRHYKIKTFILAQYVTDVSSAIRSQIDYIICFKEGSVTTRKKLHTYWGGNIKQQQFFSLLDACTQNYEALVIDNTSIGDINTMYMWFKANLNLPPFKMGSKSWWEFSEKKNEEIKENLKKNKLRQRRLPQAGQRSPPSTGTFIIRKL